MRQKKRAEQTDLFRKKNAVYYLLFAVSLVLSVMTTYYVSANYIDSDTSSELILAKHWIDTGNIFSEDWLYGAELRFLHVQLAYVPLMLITDNWQMVRFFGAVILQGVYLISFACLTRAAKLDKKFFFVGGTMLLLPVSVSYGRIVLYHNHYLPNITISFFILSLALGFAENVNWRERKTLLRLAALLLLSFAGGLNSIRQLMITHIPLVAIVFVLSWVEDAGNENKKKSALFSSGNAPLLIASVLAAVSSYAGLVCQRKLAEKLGLSIAAQPNGNRLGLLSSELVDAMLYGFFHQFGYREGSVLLSLPGILSLSGIVAGIYLIVISIKRVVRHRNTDDKRITVISLFFVSYTLVMISVFLTTGGASSSYYYPLYLSLAFPWAVPLLLITLKELPRNMHFLQAPKLFAFVLTLLLMFNGVANTTFFHGSERFNQFYEGLSFQNKHKKAELTGVLEYVQSQGYDKGYALHWESNILTEMSNGEIPMVTLQHNANGEDGKENYLYYSCLTSVWLRESPCSKPFLLIPASEKELLAHSDIAPYCTCVHSDENHAVYSIDDLDEFMDVLRY